MHRLAAAKLLGWTGRNPLSIQVCFNAGIVIKGTISAQAVVIPYQFRSVSIGGKKMNELTIFVVIPYQFRSVSIAT